MTGGAGREEGETHVAQVWNSVTRPCQMPYGAQSMVLCPVQFHPLLKLVVGQFLAQIAIVELIEMSSLPVASEKCTTLKLSPSMHSRFRYLRDTKYKRGACFWAIQSSVINLSSSSINSSNKERAASGTEQQSR